MKILHLIASVAPESGGTVEYARIMAEAHAVLGHQSTFVTLDRPEAPMLQSMPFKVLAVGPAKPRATAIKRYADAVAAAAKDADVAVIHGLWHVANMAGLKPLEAANVPWLTFPHGMLDPYFRTAKPIKHWLKQIAWAWRQGRALSRAHSVLFTCEEERRLAKNAFWGHQNYQSRVVAFCASDLTIPDADFTEGQKAFAGQVPNLNGRKYLLFLSRIHPKKACDNLIQAFANVSDTFKDIDLVFAGPNQVGWQSELEMLAHNLGVDKRVHWAGMTKGAAKAAAFNNAEAFVLPSHQENFGIVVAEALSVSLPVLISHKVNIWREIVEDGAGIASKNTVEEITRVLHKFLSLEDEKRVMMKSCTRPCYDKRFSVESAAHDLLSVLQEAVKSRGTKA